MKLHLVAPHYPPNPQVLGRWVRAVGRRLARRDHEVVVHTRHKGPDGSKLPPREEVAGLTVRRYKATLHLGDQVVLFDPKIEQGTVLLNGYGIVVNDRVLDAYDGPVVYHLHHGIDPPTHSLAASLYKAVYNPLVAAEGLKECDGVLTSTDQEHARLVKMGVDRDRIRTAPYGLPPDRLETLADPAPGEDLGDFFLFPGPLERSRRPSDLLEAVGAVPGSRAVFAGPEGPAARWIEHRTQEMGLDDRVTVIRDPDEATYLGLVRASLAVVLPNEDGYPVHALDAWSQARGVIAARTDGVPWVVDDGGDGLLYPRGDIGALRDHMRWLLDDPSRAEKLGEQGRRQAKRHSWEAITDRVETFLREVA